MSLGYLFWTGEKGRFIWKIFGDIFGVKTENIVGL